MKKVFLFLLTILSAGCSTKITKMSTGIINLPPLSNLHNTQDHKNQEKNRIKSTNALWQKEYNGKNFYKMPVNYKVGDIIKIIINIDAQAKLSSEFNKSKSSSSKTNNTLTRIIDNLLEKLTNNNVNLFKDGNVFNNDFKGTGSSNQKENITSEISTMVRTILPNDNMIIVGSQEVVVNNEKRIISIKGVIKKDDIIENCVDSSKVAESRVEYTGHGAVSNSSYQNYLDYILNIIGTNELR